MTKSRVSIVRCPDYDRRSLNSALSESIALLGGFSSFIRPRSRVLVKPNLLMAKAPQEYAICTHPEVIRAVVRMLKEHGAKVFIGDGPAAWGGQSERIQELYEVTGVSAIAKEEGAVLDYFQKNKFRGKFPLAEVLDNVDHVVSVAKFKTHGLTVLTAGVKNIYGLLKSSHKARMHSDFFDPEEFSSVLLDIYEQVRPDLTIVDGIVACEGNGPGTGGSKKNVGLLVSSANAVALDSVLAVIMGIKPQDVPYLRIAAKRGLKGAALEDIEISGVNIGDLGGTPFKLADTTVLNFFPRPLARILAKFIKFFPKVIGPKCRNCFSCVKACPEGVISPVKNNAGVTIDYQRCISCFCCQESCPHEAIIIKKSLLARLIGM